MKWVECRELAKVDDDDDDGSRDDETVEDGVYRIFLRRRESKLSL